MKKLTLIVRILLGLGFFAAGVSYFFTTPPPIPDGPVADFMKGLMATHYFMYLLKGCESLCGLLLILGQFVPLALVVLAPIILNIVLVNAFLMPQMIAPGLILGALEVYLAFFSLEYSPTIKQLFKRK